VVDRQLKQSRYLACDDYTIADMATMPWLRFPERQGVQIDEYPALQKWRDALLERPAVKRALQVLADRRRPPNEMSKEQKENLFGAAQYARR
jgi:GST-like protein